MNPLYINLRCLQRRTTGVQRYTTEITTRLGLEWWGLAPRRSLGHVEGPLWDQSGLLFQARKGVLWSPANSGPMLHPRHIITIHDLAPLKKEAWFSPAFRYYYAKTIPMLAARSIHILTDSHFIRDEMLSILPIRPEKVEVVYPGVEPKFFVDADPEMNRPYVLAVGSLDPRKNLTRLFRSWERVHHRFPEFELRVVGGSSSIFKGVDLSNISGQGIRFLQNITDAELVQEYRRATAFAYPSLYEGFGLPVLEAMAAGLPVLTSEHSPMAEFAKGAALLVDPGSEEAIEAGLVRLLLDADLRQRLGSEGRSIAHDLTWDRTAKAVTGILRRHCDF